MFFKEFLKNMVEKKKIFIFELAQENKCVNDNDLLSSINNAT